MFHARDLKRAVHSIRNPNQGQCPPIFLMSYIGTHHRTDAGGIHVRNVSEVDDEGTRIVCPYFALEVEQVRNQQRSAEAQDSLARLWTGDILNHKGV